MNHSAGEAKRLTKDTLMNNAEKGAVTFIFLIIGAISAGVAFGPAAGVAAFFLFGAVAA